MADFMKRMADASQFICQKMIVIKETAASVGSVMIFTFHKNSLYRILTISYAGSLFLVYGNAIIGKQSIYKLDFPWMKISVHILS